MDPTAFDEVWAIDTEWGFHGGRVDCESAWEPILLCAINVQSGDRVHFWGRDPRLRSWLSDHRDALFVAHNVVAEMKYLLRLGVPLPEHWFDTMVVWRVFTNRPNFPPAGLSKVLHRLGLARMAPAEKKDLQLRLARLEVDLKSPAERRMVLDYCFSDCDGCVALFSTLWDRVRWEILAHWTEYLKAVARMELRGIPIDLREYHRFWDARPLITASLVESVNGTWPVYQDGVFKKKSFLRWCQHNDVSWPVRVSPTTGRLYPWMESDVFKDMAPRHPFIEEVHQTRKTIQQFGRRTMVIDEVSGRHYYSTMPFGTVTGRNAPKGFIFAGPKWQRFLVEPESPDHVLVNVDFTAQEVGLAAALSGDSALREVYESSDCHMAFAIRAGAAPPDATKSSHGHIRKRYKTVNLGIQYGQTAFGIAARLGVETSVADALVANHRRLFPQFWDWSERTVQGAFDRGSISTPCGWRAKVPPLSNERTWMNWPLQAAGSDIMRLVVAYLDRQNVRILAPLHDGFLLSCRRDQLEDLRAAADYACQTAVDHVIPGFPMRWDFTVHEGRYEDEDGKDMWKKLVAVVDEKTASNLCATCARPVAP